MAKGNQPDPCEFFLDRVDDDTYVLGANALLMDRDVFCRYSPEWYRASVGTRLADRLYLHREAQLARALAVEGKTPPTPPPEAVPDSFSINQGVFSFGDARITVEFRDLVAHTVERRTYYESNHYVSMQLTYNDCGEAAEPTFEIVPDTYEFLHISRVHRNMRAPLKVML